MLGKYLVYENIKTAPRHRLFSFMGVPFTATPNCWKGIVARVIFGIVVALLVLPSESIVMRILFGLLYGVLFELTYLIHNLGHILGGTVVGAPMDEVLITSTRYVNIYHGPQEFPARVHLGRASGGPILNLVVGIVALMLAGTFGHPMIFFAIMNLFFGFGSFFPIPSVDGEVIWRELRH